MAKFCTNCGSSVDDTAVFCSKCGKAAPGPSAGTPVGAPVTISAGGLTDNVAGMLAYVTIIPAIIFLVIEPYNRNSFVRFHSFQSLFFGLAWFVITTVLAFIPILGWTLLHFVHILFLVLWIILLIKAYGGTRWKLPVIGDLAEKQAAAM
jgi:uncharacterized membrane protein